MSLSHHSKACGALIFSEREEWKYILNCQLLLDLTRDYEDINMHIVEYFEKAYMKYN